MSKPSQYILKDLLVALVTGIALASASCAVGYRVYDPEYGAYHNWDSVEENNYRVYLDSRHEPYHKFRSMDESQQRNYWKWRHDRGEADRPGEPAPR